MEDRRLKLVAARAHDGGSADRPLAAIGLALILAACAAVATWIGVRPAREPIQAREMAESALQQALSQGSASARSILVEMRSTLGKRPLDSNTRAVYANLLLGFSRRFDDRHAAAFHAELAAELAPVTVPVVRVASIVLIQSGEAERGLAWIGRMFGYDAPAAAELLAQVEPLLFSEQVVLGLPDDPDAWAAWSRELRGAERIDEADAWVERAFQRWPDHLPTMRPLAARAARLRDWDRLAELLPPGRALPEERAAGSLLGSRALLEAHRGDTAAAVQDIESALALDGDSSSTLLLVGDAFEELGQGEEARRHWTRGLYQLSPTAPTFIRRELLLRLARLEDREGEPARALRHWRSVLEIDARHPEARRRIEDLTGQPVDPD